MAVHVTHLHNDQVHLLLFDYDMLHKYVYNKKYELSQLILTI